MRDDSGQIVSYDDHLAEMQRVKDVLRDVMSIDVMSTRERRYLQNETSILDKAFAILAEVD